MKKRMFNDKFKLTEMVIQRRKTMTSDILQELGAETKLVGTNENGDFEFRIGSNYNTVAIKPKFKVGEVVAVAQSYETVYNNTSLIRVNWREYMFKKYAGTTPWNNKMYVRADLMPHQIRIEKVKCERLHAISEDDILKEGIIRYEKPLDINPYVVERFYYKIPGTNLTYGSESSAFQYLVAKIFGKGMFLWLKQGNMIESSWCKDPMLKGICDANGGKTEGLPTICMKTADNKVLTGWLASQTDMLSEDWVVTE